jgi:hypothetical protein
LRSRAPLAKAGPRRFRTPGPFMSAILMIIVFVAALIALNVAEHGRAD